jgi:hypothetical protein
MGILFPNTSSMHRKVISEHFPTSRYYSRTLLPCIERSFPNTPHIERSKGMTFPNALRGHRKVIPEHPHIKILFPNTPPRIKRSRRGHGMSFLNSHYASRGHGNDIPEHSNMHQEIKRIPSTNTSSMHKEVMGMSFPNTPICIKRSWECHSRTLQYASRVNKSHPRILLPCIERSKRGHLQYALRGQ